MINQNQNISLNEDELLHQRGQEAEAFIRELEEGNKYFLGVLQGIQQNIVDAMIGLKPLQRDEFTILKAQLECLYEPIRQIHADVLLGKQALDRINGVVDMTKGIL
jgi:hypothetical protein